MIYRNAVASFLVTAVLSGCISDRTDSSGEADDSAWRIDPTPVVVIGEEEGAPEYLFNLVGSVHFVSDEEFLVSERDGTSLRLYDLHGNHLQTIGRRGEGPGELMHLTGIWISPPDTVHVFDLRMRRITTFLLDGTLLGTTPLAQEGRPGRFVGAFGDGSFVLGWIDNYVSRGIQAPLTGTAPDTVKYEHFSAGGRYLGPIAAEAGVRRYFSGVRGSAVPSPVPPSTLHHFTPNPRALIQGDTMFFADGLRPDITLRTKGGKVVRTITLPRTDVSVAEAMDGLRSAIQETGDEEVLSQLEAAPEADSIPRIAAMLMDDEGLIWAKKYDPMMDPPFESLWLREFLWEPQGGEWWVIDREGSILATVAVPDGFIPMDVRGSLMAGITVDQLDVERVVIYRILSRS